MDIGAAGESCYYLFKTLNLGKENRVQSIELPNPCTFPGDDDDETCVPSVRKRVEPLSKQEFES